MKDFDTERRERRAEHEKEQGDRSFVLSGETFTYRAVTSYTVLEKIGSDKPMSVPELIEIMESALLDMIEPGQDERILAVLRNTDDPFTFADLTALVQWLTEAQTERPTKASSSSGDGDATTSTPSKGSSSSRPAAASVA